MCQIVIRQLVQLQTALLLQGETVQRLDGEGAKQMSDGRSFTPEDFEERVRLPAGRVGDTRRGNEYSGGKFEKVRSRTQVQTTL